MASSPLSAVSALSYRRCACVGTLEDKATQNKFFCFGFGVADGRLLFRRQSRSIKLKEFLDFVTFSNAHSVSHARKHSINTFSRFFWFRRRHFDCLFLCLVAADRKAKTIKANSVRAARRKSFVLLLRSHVAEMDPKFQSTSFAYRVHSAYSTPQSATILCPKKLSV